MKNAIFTVLMLCASLYASYAQKFQWGKQYTVSPFNDMLESGGFVYGTGYGPILSKCDSKGNLLWAKGDNKFTGGMAIQQDAAGYIYVAGNFSGDPIVHTNTGDVTLNTYVGDVFLAKMDTAGNVLWIVQSTSTDAAYTNGLQIDPKGNIVVVGHFDKKISFGSMNFTTKGSDDIFLACYGATGSLQWAEQFGGAGSDAVSSLFATAQGKLIIAGVYTGDAAFGAKTAQHVAGQAGFLVEVNPGSGSVNWVQANPTLFYAQLFYIHNRTQICADVLFKGSLTAGGQTYSSSGTYGAALLKTDTGFNNISATQMDFSPDFLLCADDGTATMAGTFDGTEQINDNLQYNSYGESDVYMASFADDGTMLWSLHSGGPNIDQITAMEFTSDGQSILVGGTIQSGPAKFGNITIPGDFSGSAGFMLKLYASRSGIPNSMADAIPETGVFPNPVSHNSFVRLALPNGQGTEKGFNTVIYDLAGKVVASEWVSYSDRQLWIANLKPGMYVVRLNTESAVYCTRLTVQ